MYYRSVFHANELKHIDPEQLLLQLTQLTKQRCINVGETFYFGCENVLILRLGEFSRKVFLMFSKRFRSTLQKTFLQRCQSLYTTFL